MSNWVLNAMMFVLLSTDAFAAAGTGAASADQPAVAQGEVKIAQADTSMTEGEVRKVDRDNKTITLKHGEIKNLKMSAMTMVFKVKDPVMLDQVKQGDKVRFSAEQVSGTMVVTKIEPAK